MINKIRIDPLLVRIEQAADMLALSRSRVYELLHAGEISSVKAGRSRRVIVDSIYEFIARLQEEQRQN